MGSESKIPDEIIKTDRQTLCLGQVVRECSSSFELVFVNLPSFPMTYRMLKALFCDLNEWPKAFVKLQFNSFICLYCDPCEVFKASH